MEDTSTLEDLPEQDLREIEQFFVAFMQLEGDGEAEVRGWYDPEKTHKIIRECTY